MPKNHVTIKDVANAAGVSFQTVSKVLNQNMQVSKETEKRILEAVNDLGYRPSYTARSLRAKRSFTVGYSWAPSPPNQSNPILDSFLQSMFLEAEVHGYYLLSFPFHEDYQQHLSAYNELIDTGRVDGFVLSSIGYQDKRLTLLQERKFPFVCFGRSNPELDFNWIDVDGGDGIRQAVNHILEQGHTRVGVLAWPEDSRVGNNRIEGYFTTMRAAGLPLDPAWIRRGQGCYDFGFQATQELLALPEAQRPTALIAMNDMMAVGAIQAAKKAGLAVGPQFAVAGFDNDPMVQYIDPPLTTVGQPIEAVGRRIISMLLTLVQSEDQQPEVENILLKPQLVIRASTLRGSRP